MLKVGRLDETINLVAHSNLVETRSTAVGQVIKNEQLVEMPLDGRELTDLILLSGVAPLSSSDLV